MVLAGVEFKMLVSETDALTTRPLSCALRMSNDNNPVCSS